MDLITSSWPWYVSGPLIALIMFMLIFSGKNFGMSANLRTMCAIGGGGKWSDFFRFNWKDQSWNLMVVLGAMIGGFIAYNFLMEAPLETLNPKTIVALNEIGITVPKNSLIPMEFASFEYFTLKNLSLLALAGFLVGFGARYAGGCTSGHAISGLSDLQIPSLIAVIGFFIGGILMTHIILPVLL